MSTAEHYTPQWLADIAHDVMGGINLDPSSCEEANRTIGADDYFTKEQDGLQQAWGTYGARVFINPPGQCGDDFPVCHNTKACSCNLPLRFWQKATGRFTHEAAHIFWIGFNVGQLRVFQSEVLHPLSPLAVTCFPSLRIRFSGNSPRYDNYVTFLSRDKVAKALFTDAMRKHGAVING